MFIEIYHTHALSSGSYVWKVYDGPDGIDHRSGYANTLDDAFLRCKNAIHEIGMQYVNDYVTDDH